MDAALFICCQPRGISIRLPVLNLTWCCVTGILVWSLALVRVGHDLAGGVLFAILLNMKHLFACLAPVYFVYLLRHHCRHALPHALIEDGVYGTCDILCYLSCARMHNHDHAVPCDAAQPM